MPQIEARPQDDEAVKFATIFPRLSAKKKALVMWRKYCDPDLSIEECLHECSKKGHLMISDLDKDLDWNQHFILMPEKCKVCGVKFYQVLRVQYTDHLAKEFPDNMSAVPESSSTSD